MRRAAELRHRPSRARGHRRRLLHCSGSRPDEPTVGHAGLPRRPLYPLGPDPAIARRLAGGGHHDAELYCVLEGGSPRAAQIIKNNLAAIGIDVHVHCMPGDAITRGYSATTSPGISPSPATAPATTTPASSSTESQPTMSSTSPTTTTPGSAGRSALPHASPASFAPRPTPRSTWH